MSGTAILICFLSYSLLLFAVTWFTSRNAGNNSFFLGNKQSPWYVVAYGMIGASLSGVTFMSVPGFVGANSFSYMMVVFGYLFGYFIISGVLLPLYYRLNLTSIYSYLEMRFGHFSYRTGAFFFLLSRTLGASFRMFLVVNVLQVFVFDQWGVPFWVTVSIFILLVLLYTFEGGIKTIVWTDTLQTTFMLLAVIISIILIAKQLDLGFFDLLDRVEKSKYSQIIFTDWTSKNHYIKQFISGIFITVVMTGLDQEMMQKNLSCRNLKDAQKNMLTFSAVLVFVNVLFLILGSILYIYCESTGKAVPANSDDLFPMIAINQLGPIAGLVFVVGLISAAYPSADGALTSLTTSVCVDFLDFQKKDWDEQKKKRLRYVVHVSFALVLLLVIVVFRAINNQAVVGKLFTVAGYTYGPLLGLYAFGLFTQRTVKDKLVPVICILSPLVCYLLNENSVDWFYGYKFGFELLILNGILTFTGVLLISQKSNVTV
jgi:Na+/proline symporter